MINKEPKFSYLMRLAKAGLYLICVILFEILCNASILGVANSVFAITIVYGVIYFLMVKVYDAYVVGYSRIVDMVYSQTLSNVVALVICYVISSVILLEIINPIPFFLVLVIDFIISILWSVCFTKLYFRINKAKDTVLLYKEDNDLNRVAEAMEFPQRFNIINKIKVNDMTVSQVLESIKNIPVVFVSGLNTEMQNSIAKYCVENNVYGYFAPHVGDVIMAGSKHVLAFSVPIVSVRRCSPAPEYLFVKRLFDVVMSLLGIIILSPIMIITAVIIKLYDKGPVFYKQTRLTKDGKEFRIIKFRSMRVDAEKDGVARLATENDNRITPIGKIIRACRIDELPQLFNILAGDMTIVGPRPERPEIAEEYLKEIPSFNLRLQVTAGLTGYAQIYGKYNTNPYDKLEMDLMYINKMSIITDLRLMFATVRVLFMKESTSGIKENQTTAIK